MLARFESPNAWFRNALKRRKISTNAAARHISLSSPQVSRWANEHEPIPRHHLWELAELLSPAEADYVQGLKAWEELAARLDDAVRTFSSGDAHADAALAHRVENKLDELLAQQMAASPAERVSGGVRFLLSAVFALHCGAALMNGSSRSLVSIENVMRHVRYPVNHFVGLLMDLGNRTAGTAPPDPVFADFRLRALRSLRETASSGGRTSLGTAFVQDHSKHLLVRHGDPADQDAIETATLLGTRAEDAMTRRLAYAGLALAHGHSDIAQRYLHDLQDDEHLRLANITFDAIHYGDEDLGHSDRIDKRVTAVPARAIRHIVRHVVLAGQYSAIRPIEEQTVADLYALFGMTAFDDPVVVELLRRHLSLADCHSATPRFNVTAAEIVAAHSSASHSHLFTDKGILT